MHAALLVYYLFVPNPELDVEKIFRRHRGRDEASTNSIVLDFYQLKKPHRDRIQSRPQKRTVTTAVSQDQHSISMRISFLPAPE